MSVPQKHPKTFRKNGYTYNQVTRGTKGIIWEQITKEGLKIGYEIWKLKIQPAYGFEVNHYPEMEKKPSNNDFGKWAWTVGTLERAEDFLAMIENDTIGARRKKK